MKTKTILAAALAIAALAPVASWAGNDAISNAEKTEKDRPGIAETKAIAEEGFVYGLPIVMNYAVMYEYAVDRDSGQFKAPFNQINNEARVFTYKDTAIITPNSDTPYSIFALHQGGWWPRSWLRQRCCRRCLPWRRRLALTNRH